MSALEIQITLVCERDAAIIMMTLMMAERDSANVRYQEMLVELRRILIAWDEKKDQSADTFVNLLELFNKALKKVLCTHPAKLAKLKDKMAPSTIDPEVL